MKALELLEPYGAFDEVDVGRNFFNSGLKRYVTDLSGEYAVPQIVVMVESVRIDTLPWIYGSPTEVARLVGRSAIRQWARVGSPLRLPRRPNDSVHGRATGEAYD